MPQSGAKRSPEPNSLMIREKTGNLFDLGPARSLGGGENAHLVSAFSENSLPTEQEIY